MNFKQLSSTITVCIFHVQKYLIPKEIFEPQIILTIMNTSVPLNDYIWFNIWDFGVTSISGDFLAPSYDSILLIYTSSSIFICAVLH